MKLRSYLLCLLLGLLMACTNDNLEELDLNKDACNTDQVTYATVVRPILVANCYSCHSTGSPSAGVVLDTHAGVRQQANSGKLLGVISHTPGFKPMPQGGAKLSDCNISKIQRWIEAGAPEN